MAASAAASAARWTGLSGLWLIRDRSGGAVRGVGGGGGEGESQPSCLLAFDDQYLVGSRSFHPCDHGKRNLERYSHSEPRESPLLSFVRP